MRLGNISKGDIVVIDFPYSNLSGHKRRPALVLAKVKGRDLILAQITCTKQDSYTIPLQEEDFIENRLYQTSKVRPNKLFTADKALIKYKAGRIKKRKLHYIHRSLTNILHS